MTKRTHATHRNLAAYRKAAHLTQRQAAERFGVSQSCWAKIEAGQRRPRKALAKKLLKGTHVPLDILMGIAS